MITAQLKDRPFPSSKNGWSLSTHENINMPFYFIIIIIIDSLYVQAVAVPEAADRKNENEHKVKIYVCLTGP